MTTTEAALREALDSLAVRVLRAYRRRDGLTSYVYDDNRKRDERYMKEVFTELVMPFIASRSQPSPASSTAGEVLGKLSPANRDCIEKAEDGEPMFIILGRDPDGGNIVRLWAERRRDAGDPTHALPVLTLADEMDRWAETHLPRTAPPKEAYQPLSPSSGEPAS